MEDKERILEQKRLAKENIDKSEHFILLTDQDITGCASIVDTCGLLVNGVRVLVDENKFPKFLLDYIFDLIKADDVNEYMDSKIKELESEEK